EWAGCWQAVGLCVHLLFFLSLRAWPYATWGPPLLCVTGAFYQIGASRHQIPLFILPLCHEEILWLILLLQRFAVVRFNTLAIGRAFLQLISSQHIYIGIARHLIAQRKNT